ncbi:MAG: hypothetical protein LBU08_02260 [Tannerellaceae bacterium]|jgi:hypothetical protein|nr:hypothetical protein [Tannerellaceae bacterium]
MATTSLRRFAAVALALALLPAYNHAKSWFVVPDNEIVYNNSSGTTWSDPISLARALIACDEGDILYLKTGDYSLSPSEMPYTIHDDGLSLLGGFSGNINNPFERSPFFEYGKEYEDIARSRISAQSKNRIFLLHDVNDILFKDIVFADGSAKYNHNVVAGKPFYTGDTVVAGGAIQIEDCENITFHSVFFRNNYAQSSLSNGHPAAHGYGGAVYLRNTSANFICCQFTDNYARLWTQPTSNNFTGKGGAIYATLNDNYTFIPKTPFSFFILIDSCLFSRNYATSTSSNDISLPAYGGAICLEANATQYASRLEMCIRNSDLYDNKAFHAESEDITGYAAGGAIYQGGNCSRLTIGLYNNIYNNDNGLVVVDDPERFLFETDKHNVHWGFLHDNYTSPLTTSYPGGGIAHPDIWPDLYHTVHIPQQQANNFGFSLGSRSEHLANLVDYTSYKILKNSAFGIRLLRKYSDGSNPPALVFTNADGSLNFIPPARTIPDLNNSSQFYIEYHYFSTNATSTLTGTRPFTALKLAVHDTTLSQYAAFYLNHSVDPEDIVSVVRRSSMPAHVAFNNDGLVRALKPTPQGSPALLFTAIYNNGIFVAEDTCRVSVNPSPISAPISATLDKAYNHMPLLMDGVSDSFHFEDIAPHTLQDLRPQAGYSSRNGFIFSVIKPGIDIHQLRSYRNSYFLHIAFRAPVNPGFFYRICLNDGFASDTCIVADYCFTDEQDKLTIPHFTLPNDGKWHSLFIPLNQHFPHIFTHSSFSDNNVSLTPNPGKPFLSVTGLNAVDAVAVDGISFCTTKDLITSLSISPSIFFLNAGELQDFTLTHSPADLTPPDLICTNTNLLHISPPYGYQPGDGPPHRYTCFARQTGVGQLTLLQEPQRLFAPVIISPEQEIDPLDGNSFYLFYAGQQTANRLLATTDLVKADFRPNATLPLTSLSIDPATTLLPAITADTNSMGDSESWLRFLSPADKSGGVTFHTGTSFNPVSLSPLVNNRNNAFLHIAYRLEDGADTNRPLHPLIELTFASSYGKAIIPIGQNYLASNGSLPIADFYRRSGWNTLDIPLALPAFDPLFDRPNPVFDAIDTLLHITAKDPNSGRLYAEINLDAIFFYIRDSVHVHSLSIDPVGELDKVGDEFIFDTSKDYVDLIINFSPSHSSNKNIEWLYNPSLARLIQPDPKSPDTWACYPLIGDTLISLQARSHDGNLLSNTLSIRIPDVPPTGFSLKLTPIPPANNTNALDHNDIVAISVDFDPPYASDTDILWTLHEDGIQNYGLPAAEFVAIGDPYASLRHVRAIIRGASFSVTAQLRNNLKLSDTVTLKTIPDDLGYVPQPQNLSILPLQNNTPSFHDTLRFRIDALPLYTTHRKALWSLSSDPTSIVTLGNIAAFIIPDNPNLISATCQIRINTTADTTFYLFAQPMNPSTSAQYPSLGNYRLLPVKIHTKAYLPNAIHLPDYKIVSQNETFTLKADSLSWPADIPDPVTINSPYSWTIESLDSFTIKDNSTLTSPSASFSPVTARGAEARIILSLKSDPAVADTCIISTSLSGKPITQYAVSHNNLTGSSNFTFGDTLTLHTHIEPKEARPAGFDWTFYPSQAVEIIQSFPPFSDSIRIRPLQPQTLIVTARTRGAIRYDASHTLVPLLPDKQPVIRDVYGQQQAEVPVGNLISLTADFDPSYLLQWKILSLDGTGTPSNAAVFTDSYPNARTRTLRPDSANQTVYIVASAPDAINSPQAIFRLLIKRTPLDSFKVGRPDKPLADSSHVAYLSTVTLKAFPYPDNLKDPHPLLWSISPKGVAEFVGKDDTDPFHYTRTLQAILPNDSCVVTAQTADGSFIAHHNLFVRVPLDSLSLINPSTQNPLLSLVKAVGDTIFLNAELFPAYASFSSVQWTLSPLGFARFVSTTNSVPLQCAVKILKPNSSVSITLSVDKRSVSHTISPSAIRNITLQRINGSHLRANPDPLIVLQAFPQPSEASLTGLQWSIQPASAAEFIDNTAETDNMVIRTLSLKSFGTQEAFVHVRDPQTGVSASFPLHNPVFVSSISLTADASYISHGTEVRLHASIAPDTAYQSILWEAHNIATQQSLPIVPYPDADGNPVNAILAIDEPNQQVLVTAAAVDGSGRLASTLITSKPAPFERLSLTALDKNGRQTPTNNLRTGDTLFIRSGLYPASSAPNGLFWNISPLHAARFIDAVPVGQLYTGASVRGVKILSNGGDDFTVSVSHPTDLNGSKAANLTLHVAEPEPEIPEPEEPQKAPPVSFIVLLDGNGKNEAKIRWGDYITLNTTLYPKEVILKNVKWTISPDDAVEWTAASPTALSRSFTPRSSDDTVTITVSTLDGEPKSASFTLYLLPRPVASISLRNITPNPQVTPGSEGTPGSDQASGQATSGDQALTPGTQASGQSTSGSQASPGIPLTIQATILPFDATDRRLQWSVSPAGVALFDPATTAAALVLTPLFYDTTFLVTASTLDGSALSASLPLSTIPPPPSPLDPLDPSDPNSPLDPLDPNSPLDPLDPNSPLDPSTPTSSDPSSSDPSTAISAPDADTPPAVSYHNGYLRLINFQGYLCRLTSLTGRTLLLFPARTPLHLQPHPLTPGIYLLSAQKDSHTRTLRFLVR